MQLNVFSYSFFGAKSFNQSVDDWDISNVTNMDFLNVINMDSMIEDTIPTNRKKF